MTFEFQHHLDCYPKLREWLLENGRNATTPSSSFMASVCSIISQSDGPMRFKMWNECLHQFLTTSIAPYDDYIDIDKTFAKRGFALQDFCVELATWAITNNYGQAFQTQMQSFADQTGLVSFRFLSAWSCLNLDQLDHCISECKKVTEEYAPVLTLYGQAALESGDCEQSITVLEQAVDIAPEEILGWFQLAKSYSLIERYEACWHCLMQCHRIESRNIEVAIFVALTALNTKDHEHLDTAWNILQSHYEEMLFEPLGVEILIDLCIARTSAEDLSHLIGQVELGSLTYDKSFASRIPHWLEDLESPDFGALKSQFEKELSAPTRRTSAS